MILSKIMISIEKIKISLKKYHIVAILEGHKIFQAGEASDGNPVPKRGKHVSLLRKMLTIWTDPPSSQNAVVYTIWIN